MEKKREILKEKLKEKFQRDINKKLSKEKSVNFRCCRIQKSVNKPTRSQMTSYIKISRSIHFFFSNFFNFFFFFFFNFVFFFSFLFFIQKRKVVFSPSRSVIHIKIWRFPHTRPQIEPLSRNFPGFLFFGIFPISSRFSVSVRRHHSSNSAAAAATCAMTSPFSAGIPRQLR